MWGLALGVSIFELFMRIYIYVYIGCLRKIGGSIFWGVQFGTIQKSWRFMRFRFWREIIQEFDLGLRRGEGLR